MLITASNSYSNSYIGRSSDNAASKEAASLPTESFTLSSASPEPSIGTRVGYGTAWGVMGAVPFLGTATNVGAAMGSVWDRNNVTAGVIGLVGAGANLVGSLSTVGGMITGNSTALNVGFTLLGASALAGAGLGVTVGASIK